MALPNNTLKKRVVSGFMWRFAERSGANIARFVVSIILARLIAPEIFGILAIVTVFMNFADLLVESGFGKSLIQKENADEVDFSTIFYFTTATSILLYVLLFFAAPTIANFFEYPQMTLILRWLNLRLLITGINIAQTAYATRHMQFKLFFWSTSGAVVLSAAVSIVMAYNGFGVWALVANHLVSSITGTTILLFILNWKPKLTFSWQRLKPLYSYGWKILISSVLYRIYKEMRTLLIGRLYSTGDLAFYSKGKSFPALISNNSTSIINKVIFPAISQKQRSADDVKSIMRQSISATSYFVWPVMIGLAIIAEPLVLFLLTDKWIEAVPFLQIACFYHAFQPIRSINAQAINAIGRSDITLKLKIIKTIIGIAILLLAMNYGILAIALSTVITAFIFSLVNSLPNIKLINYRPKEQMADILPYIAMSAVMSAAIYPIKFLNMSDVLTILVQVVVGLSVYLLLSIILKQKSFYFIIDTIKQHFKKN